MCPTSPLQQDHESKPDALRRIRHWQHVPSSKSPPRRPHFWSNHDPSQSIENSSDRHRSDHVLLQLTSVNRLLDLLYVNAWHGVLLLFAITHVQMISRCTLRV